MSNPNCASVSEKNSKYTGMRHKEFNMAINWGAFFCLWESGNIYKCCVPGTKWELLEKPALAHKQADE